MKTDKTDIGISLRVSTEDQVRGEPPETHEGGSCLRGRRQHTPVSGT